jgi:hypothetical protein
LLRIMFKNKLIILAVIFLRILSAVFIVINPLWGFILFIIFDYLDAYFLEHIAGMGWNTYQQLDKKIDIIGLLAMVYWGYLSGAFLPFFGFLIYRLIGEVVFFYTKKQSTLLFFPNFIEPFFLWRILITGAGRSLTLLIILLILQVLIEYYLHIFWPNYLKANGFPRLFRIFGLTRVKDWS